MERGCQKNEGPMLELRNSILFVLRVLQARVNYRQQLFDAILIGLFLWCDVMWCNNHLSVSWISFVDLELIIIYTLEGKANFCEKSQLTNYTE